MPDPLAVFDPAPTSHVSAALCRAALLLARSATWQALLAEINPTAVINEAYALARIYFDSAEAAELTPGQPFMLLSDTEGAAVTVATQAATWSGIIYALIEVPVSADDADDPLGKAAALRFRNRLGGILADCALGAGADGALYPDRIELASPPMRAHPDIRAEEGDFYQAKLALRCGGA